MYFRIIPIPFNVMIMKEARRAREEGERRRKERDHKYGKRRHRRRVIFHPDSTPKIVLGCLYAFLC